MTVDMIIALCALLAGGAIGFAWAWTRFSARLRQADAALMAKTGELAVEQQSRAIERDSHARLVAEKEATYRELLEARRREFAELIRTLEEKFANLAAATLESKAKNLTEVNQTSLAAALKPLAEQLGRFQEATQKAQNDNRALGQSIHQDIETIGRYAKDLSDFSVAIKSGNTVQGRKGEEILAEKLRQAGLEENVTFFLQEGTGQDRPDAQVCDAENRWLIIDSKVSLTAFIDSRSEALDDATRRQRLKDHVESVRSRIVSLRDKKYPEVFARQYPERNYLPVAAMFVPYESALAAALEADPSLWQLALAGNVVLVTPLTLTAYLRLVYLAWQNRKVEQGCEEIIKDAEELLSRMNGFLLAFEGVGTALKTAQTSYDDAWKVIVEHPKGQTIGGSARKLCAAGLKLLNKKGEKKALARCLQQSSEVADV